MFVGVDSVIFGFNGKDLYLLIVKRAYPPRKGAWTLMGGFVRNGEDLDAAAQRTLEDLTGLENVYIKQVGAFGKADRDSGARVISVAYYALIDVKDYDANFSGKYGARWVKIDEIPPLVFDHREIVDRAREIMRNDARNSDAAFNLLPKMFTLTKLNKLFEAILGKPIDKRNFRKKVAELKYIKPTGKIDQTDSKRGAMLYTFDKKIYDRSNMSKLL